MKKDVCVWLDFLENFNGKTPFPELIWSNNDTLQLFTDSCGSCGGGAFFNNHWTVLVWPSTWDLELRRDITYLELIPILVAIWLWSEQLAAKKLLINTDNMALVHIVNSKSSKTDRVMSLIRPLVLICLKHNIQIKATHIIGYKNSIADSISRFQWQRFRTLAPHADPFPTQIPPALLTRLGLI